MSDYAEKIPEAGSSTSFRKVGTLSIYYFTLSFGTSAENEINIIPF